MSDRVGYIFTIDELVDAILRIRALGVCLDALGEYNDQNGIDDSLTLRELGQMVEEQANRLDGVVATLGELLEVRVA